MPLGNCNLNQDTTTNLLEWLKSKTLTSNSDKDEKNSFIAGGNTQSYSHFGTLISSFLKINHALIQSSNQAPYLFTLFI